MPPGDMRKHGPRFQEGLVKNLILVDRVTELAKKKGCTTVQLALAWLLAKGPGAGWHGQYIASHNRGNRGRPDGVRCSLAIKIDNAHQLHTYIQLKLASNNRHKRLVQIQLG